MKIISACRWAKDIDPVIILQKHPVRTQTQTKTPVVVMWMGKEYSADIKADKETREGAGNPSVISRRKVISGGSDSGKLHSGS